MKSVVKGNTFEKEVKEYLEKNGWEVFRQHRKPMFIAGRMITAGADIFGCDLVAKKLSFKPLWVQVSTFENIGHKKEQVMKFSWTLEHERLQIWGRLSGVKEYRVFELTGLGGLHGQWHEEERVHIGKLRKVQKVVASGTDTKKA